LKAVFVKLFKGFIMGCCGRRIADKMPSLAQQAKNLLLSTANVLAYAATTGQIKADAAVAAIRVDLCKKCRHLESNNRCTVCGCFISMKAGLIAEKCPLKKW